MKYYKNSEEITAFSSVVGIKQPARSDINEKPVNGKLISTNQPRRRSLRNMVYQKIIQMLDQRGLAYRLHEHPPVTTIEEAIEKVPHLTRNLLKTVVFRIKGADWILAAVKGSDRIHYKKLANALDVKRTDLRSISPDQVASELGFEVGGVGPFPACTDIRVVFDESLGQLGTIFCGSGKNTRTIEMKIDNLIGLSGGHTYPICR